LSGKFHEPILWRVLIAPQHPDDLNLVSGVAIGIDHVANPELPAMSWVLNWIRAEHKNLHGFQ
jgi:hypothetical protein